ncbi:MAG: hypothetical protein ACTHJ4_02340 [Candidatus Nucleicultricaceae bacterium]
MSYRSCLYILCVFVTVAQLISCAETTGNNDSKDSYSSFYGSDMTGSRGYR